MFVSVKLPELKWVYNYYMLGNCWVFQSKYLLSISNSCQDGSGIFLAKITGGGLQYENTEAKTKQQAIDILTAKFYDIILQPFGVTYAEVSNLA